MLGTLNRFIDGCSRKWWKVLLLFMAQATTIGALNAITARFPQQTDGDIPFDMQNDLEPAQVFEQLAGYSEAAFTSYYAFQAIDYVFPVVSSLFLAAVAAFGLRHAFPRLYGIALDRKLLLLMLVPAAFDYLENVFLLWAVTAWPEQPALAAQLAVAAKTGKLSTLYLAFGFTGVVLIVALGRWAVRRLGG